MMCAMQPVNSDLLTPLMRRAFPLGASQLEHVAEGTSTWVYRAVSQGATFYLRILPEADASFGPEVAVHERVRRLGVKAPEIVYYEPTYEPLQRSVMVVREIPGRPLSQSTDLDAAALSAILLEAGRDLARINSILVDGFGWMTRDAKGTRLRAPLPTFRAFALEQWENDLAYLAATGVILASEVSRLEQTCAHHDGWLDARQGVLAHGDFDTTAIYQLDGHYTGTIDFGEIRGADRWYDLGHFHLRDGEYLPMSLMRPLVRGYSEAQALPRACGRRICFASLLINVRALSRSLRKRPPDRFTLHQFEALRADLAMLAE